MYDQGHFCLFVFAQGNWKAHYKDQLNKNISDRFLSMVKPKNKQEELQIGWNEIETSSLREPAYYKNCKICNHLAPIFKDKKSSNEGLILFSHNIPDEIDFRSFFSFLLGQSGVKKVYYLEVDIYSEGKAMKGTIPEKSMKKSELFKLVNNKKFEQVVFYEILKDKFY